MTVTICDLFVGHAPMMKIGCDGLEWRGLRTSGLLDDSFFSNSWRLVLVTCITSMSAASDQVKR
jgi:hypothetical protein